MRKKNKLITLILLFTLSFSAISISKTQKAEAAMVSTAIFLAGVKFSAFAGFASLFYVNGYHMQISDLAIKFANTYYDYANGVYTAKGSKMNELDKFNLYASSVLTGNLKNNITLEDLNELKDIALNNFNTKQNMADLIVDMTINREYVGMRTVKGVKEFPDNFKDKILKLQWSQQYPEYYVVMDTKIIGYTSIKVDPYFSELTPNIRVYEPSGKSHIVSAFYYLGLIDMDLRNQKFKFTSRMNIDSDILVEFDVFKDNYIPETEDLIQYKDNTFATNAHDYVYPYPNYYSALNGTSATTLDELKGLMNTDEYLQREILKLLENQKVNEENIPIVPVTLPDGTLSYPVPKEDTPPIYSPGQTWYNDIFGLLANVPDLLIGATTDLIDDKVVPAINSIVNTLAPSIDKIKDTVTSIPGLITNVWDTTIDVPMEQINFDKLKLNGFTTKFPFSIPFDYVRIISALNVSPIEPDLTINVNTKYLKVNHSINSNSIDKFIAFFRWFVLLTFIIGLMMITRKVIKW